MSTVCVSTVCVSTVCVSTVCVSTVCVSTVCVSTVLYHKSIATMEVEWAHFSCMCTSSYTLRF